MSTEPQIGSVRTGISLIYWSLVITILTVLAFCVLPYSISDPFTRFNVLKACINALIGASVMSIVGKLMCLEAPEQTGARPYIFVSVFADGLVASINIASLFTALPAYAEPVKHALTVLGFILFLLFMKQLALHVNRRDIAERATAVITLGAVFIGIVLLIALSAFATSTVNWLAILAPSAFVLALAFVLTYVGLIGRLRLAL